MRHRAADHRQVERLAGGQVVEEAGGAAQHSRVLDPPHRLPEQPRAHAPGPPAPSAVAGAPPPPGSSISKLSAPGTRTTSGKSLPNGRVASSPQTEMTSFSGAEGSSGPPATLGTTTRSSAGWLRVAIAQLTCSVSKTSSSTTTTHLIRAGSPSAVRIRWRAWPL